MNYIFINFKSEISNGVLINWGYIPLDSCVSNTKIYFSIAFTISNYSLVSGDNTKGSSSAYSVALINSNASFFTVQPQGTTKHKYSFIGIGY